MKDEEYEKCESGCHEPAMHHDSEGVPLCDECWKALLDESANGWQPIETAPKDGTEILGWREDCGVLLIRWTSCSEFLTDSELDKMDEGTAYREDWFCADFVQGARLEGEEAPTHWLPLPEPPQQ